MVALVNLETFRHELLNVAWDIVDKLLRVERKSLCVIEAVSWIQQLATIAAGGALVLGVPVGKPILGFDTR